MLLTQVTPTVDGENMTFVIGRQGENGVRAIEFDFSDFAEKFGAGTFKILHKREKDAMPYEVTLDGSRWTASDVDTAFSGKGQMIIEWRVGDALAKSMIYGTLVLPSLGEATANPIMPSVGGGVTMAEVERAIVSSIAGKTEKTRIEFDGTSFKLDGVVLTYKQLYDIHLSKPDFAFVTYGDRAYLLSYVQEDAGMKEMRFQSVLAVTDSSNLSYVKTSGIYVTSTNGVTISSVKVTDINGENKSYKATTIDNTNENSDVWYPSVKAVADYVKEQNGNKVEQSDLENYATKEYLIQYDERISAIENGASTGGTVNVSEGLKTILQRIQTEIKACVRDDSVVPNSYIDMTDSLISNLGTSTDEPSEPSEGGISVSYSGRIATINNLKNLTVSYSGNVATVGV